MSRARTAPGWVITDDYVDEELGALRAGKEAGCFLVRRRSGDRWCLLVRKDYRKRSDREYNAPVRAGERGIRSNRYRDSLVILDSRQRRAAATRTAFGKEVIERAWLGREFQTLRRLWEAGAAVPYPVEEYEHGFLMQYIGTIGAAAPRLADVRLDRDEAPALFDRLIGEMRVMAREGIVHGDLSAYNVLLQHGKPWVIDLPQSVDLYAHPRGMELFERDVLNVCSYFIRLGLRIDPKALSRELVGYDSRV
jgi:RIO kinase 1